MSIIQFDRKLRRKTRVRATIRGTSTRPRISVYRSNKYIYVQAIDDEHRNTIVSYSSLQIEKKAGTSKEKKTTIARRVGEELAQLLLAQHINSGVFDRGSYAYLGRVSALAEGLREGGIQI
ncbi:50S ribosomal protein L18 [Candidatus Roizmanbacteria bacterium]|nr:50S ribosomal protein L18 [Candidatus Roizmanbacteria bacterium]